MGSAEISAGVLECAQTALCDLNARNASPACAQFWNHLPCGGEAILSAAHAVVYYQSLDRLQPSAALATRLMIYS